MIKEILEQLAPLDAQIAALKGSGNDMEAITAHASELAELAVEEDEILRSCGPLTAEDRVFLARHPERSHIDETVSALFTDFFEQRGDRQCKEESAILGGVARFHGLPVTVIGHRKGSTLEENLACNFGMPGPEGYRKALRLMKQAEKFGRPIITFIDTPGAYPVVAAAVLAKHLEPLGIDAVIAEGTESGGHVGEMTTMALVPQVVDAVNVPVIAAGGIADGRQLAAALALGACGVQVGTCLLVSEECPIHENYKAALLKAKDSDTIVTGRIGGSPVRVLKNRMSREYVRQEKAGADKMELEKYTLGSLRRAVFEGDTAPAA